MNQIDNLTDQGDQLTQAVLTDGSILQIELFYNGATQRWTMNITHPLLTVQGINVSCFPNILRDWRNVITFGLACITTSGQDPTDIEDFVNGNAFLYTMDATEVQAAEAQIFGGVLQ